MSEPIVVIVNPVAGQGRGAQTWRHVEPALRDAAVRFEERVQQRPGHGEALAEEAARRGARVIAVVGGDGTVHEILNGIMRAETSPRPVLAVIPAGTGNDFARAVGVPKDPLAAARLLIAGQQRRIDMGWVNGRYYGAIAGVGFDAEVAAKVNRWPKRIRGTTMYVAAVLNTLAAYRPVPATITTDGRARTMRLFLLAAANTPWYAGGMHMAPHARVDDGRLEIITAWDLGIWETIRLLPKVFSGAHLTHRKVAHEGATEVRVESEVPMAIHADGETVGRVPAVFRIVPQAVEVVVPERAPRL